MGCCCCLSWWWLEELWLLGAAEKQDAQGQVDAPVWGGGGAQWRANQLGRSEDMMVVVVVVVVVMVMPELIWYGTTRV